MSEPVFKDLNSTPRLLHTIYIGAFAKTLDQPTLDKAMEAGRMAVMKLTEEEGQPTFAPTVKFEFFTEEQLLFMGWLSEEEKADFLSREPGYDDPEMVEFKMPAGLAV